MVEETGTVGGPLDWYEPVDTFADLPQGDPCGATRLVLETNWVYRRSEAGWRSLGPIAEEIVIIGPWVICVDPTDKSLVFKHDNIATHVFHTDGTTDAYVTKNGLQKAGQ